MNSNKTNTETVRVETYLNRIVLFQRIVIKLKQEKIHQPFDWKKMQELAIWTGFYLYFFYMMQQEPLARSNREQWDIIFSCLGRDKQKID